MKGKIFNFLLLCGIISPFLMVAAVSEAQFNVFKKSDLIEYTSLWKGERFPDGRPKVPDDVLERLKKVSLEEAWSVLRNNGYNNQYEDNWVIAYENPVLVGRAVTVVFMPLRPDFNDITITRGKQIGLTRNPATWVIDTLVKDDVLVVDMYGKIARGNFGGSNVFNAINAKTGVGMVINGASRDIDGTLKIPDFFVFTRGWHPGDSRERMLNGINIPTRIGMTTVMPGDIVLGGREGVIFIPAHLALEVVETSEIIRLRDEFGQMCLRQGKYTTGQIDTRWSDEIEEDFGEWLLKKRGGKMTPSEREYLSKGQTW